LNENGFFAAPRRVVQAAFAASLVFLALFVSFHPEFLDLTGALAGVSETWAKNWAGWEKFKPALHGHLLAAGVSLVLLAAAWLAGQRLFRLVGRDGGAVSSAGIGLGVAALGVLALGLAGLLFKPVLAFFFAALLASGAGIIRVRRPARGGAVWPWILAGLLLLLDLLASLSTEIFHDSLLYHLALPELFLASHRFMVTPGNMLNFLPLNTEMLYLPCLAFGGEEAAKLLNFGLGVLVVLAVAGLARRLGGNAAGWAGGIAAFLAVSMPLVAVENEITFSDNARALWELLALSWLVAAWKRREGDLARGAVAVSAVFTGLAMGSKYLSFLACGILALALYIEVARRMEWRWGRAIHAPILFISLSLLVASPWLLRNTLATRDPLYPFGHKVFHSLRWSGFEHARWMADNRYYGVSGMDFTRWVSLPVRMPLDQVPGEFGTFTTGPLLPGLALLLLLRSSWPWGARVAVALVSGEALAWSFTSHLIRYLYPALLVFCSLLGWAYAELRGKSGLQARLLSLSLLLWALCAFNHRVIHRANMDGIFGMFGSFTGKLAREDVLAGRGYGARLEALPAGRVLLVGEERALGIGRVWEGSSMYNMPVLEWWVRESGDVRRLSIRVKQAGIRSVYLNGQGFDHLKSRGDFALPAERMAVLNAWWKTLGVVFRAPPITAYAVPPFGGVKRVK
jgi:hypothetical protein